MKKQRPKHTELLAKGQLEGEKEKLEGMWNYRVFLICICCLIEETWTYFNAYKNDPFEKEQLKIQEREETNDSKQFLRKQQGGMQSTSGKQETNSEGRLGDLKAEDQRKSIR